MEALEKNKTVFDELGLELTQGKAVVGETYPIFGMITKLIDSTLGAVKIELNHSILAKINVTDAGKLEVLRQRAFETGIFLATVTALEPNIEVDCKTVIFGRPQAGNA